MPTTTQPYRMIVRAYGGPEVIECETFDPPSPGPGELLIAQDVIGLNLSDTYFRKGLYPAALPMMAGAEGAGTIVAVGPDARGFQIGDRVAAVFGWGAYATHRLIPAEHAIRLPDDVSSENAAALSLKGMTACAFAEDLTPLSAGQIVLVHSAAGGVGSILVPWLRDKGVIVIAHAGTAEKAASVPADHSLSGDFAALAGQVRELTGGKGVDVVYDGVGKDSWDASIACLKRRGLMVSYGNASGPVPPVALLDLMHAGSLFVTRPTFGDYAKTPEEQARVAERVFDRLRRGVVKPLIGQRFALKDAANAHRALEERRTVGSTLLMP